MLRKGTLTSVLRTTHYYFINFEEGLIPCVIEAHCVCFFARICYHNTNTSDKTEQKFYHLENRISDASRKLNCR